MNVYTRVASSSHLQQNSHIIKFNQMLHFKIKHQSDNNHLPVRQFGDGGGGITLSIMSLLPGNNRRSKKKSSETNKQTNK